MNRKYIPIIILLLLTLFVGHVYAQDDDTVNLLELPKRIANALDIPEFAGQMLVCSVFLFTFLLPIAIFTRNLLVTLLVGFCLMGFFIAVGWMPYWILLIIVLLISAMYSGKIKEWIT